MACGLFTCCENPGALHRDVHVSPRQLFRIADRCQPNVTFANDQTIPFKQDPSFNSMKENSFESRRVRTQPDSSTRSCADSLPNKCFTEILITDSYPPLLPLSTKIRPDPRYLSLEPITPNL